MNTPSNSKPMPGTDVDVQSGLDLDAGQDGTVIRIEHLFESNVEDTKGQPTWRKGTEPGSRSSARPRTGPSSPNPTRGGRGSLGVLMPTLLPARATFTGRGTADLGSLTHGLIGVHVPFLTPTHSGVGVPGDLLARMYTVAYAVIDANPNATRVLATEAASLAYRYLTELPPAAPWRLLGVEYDTGAGPVDVAWVHEETGEVFFDEVKTSRVVNGRQTPASWVDQARRYATAGTARFDDLFLGVRLVPLVGAHATRLVRHRMPVVPLAPTAVEPFAVSVRGGGAL